MRPAFSTRINTAFNQLSKTSTPHLPVISWACHFTNLSCGRFNATDHKVIIKARDESEAQKKFAVWANLAWYPQQNSYVLTSSKRVVSLPRRAGFIAVLQSLVM